VSEAESELESAMLAAIAADVEVRAALGIPLRFEQTGGPRPAFPYLEFVRHESRPVSGVDAETSEHLVDFAVVSRRLGGREALEAMGAVRAALAEAELEMDGWRCVFLVPVFLDATRTRPGLWRALLRVKAVVEQV
jgi:hypothetical protein